MATHSFDPNLPMRVEGRPERRAQRRPLRPDDAQRREVMTQRLEALVARLTTLALEQPRRRQLRQRIVDDATQGTAT